LEYVAVPDMLYDSAETQGRAIISAIIADDARMLRICHGGYYG